jgi:electron transfer flavoprotein beta subunit
VALNIVVCVKQTPLPTVEKTLLPDGRLNRAATEKAMSGYDEVAVEEALRVQEQHGGEVTVLTMGPQDAVEAVRKALAMGADRAVLITDDALAGTDARGTARVLAAAITRLHPDLVIMGMQSDDAGTGVVHHALAEHAGLPALTHTAKLTIEDRTVTTHRRREDGYAMLQAQLPAVVGVIDVINQPRYPSLRGIMAAKRKPLETWTVADLGLETPATVGLQGARTRVVNVEKPPARAAGEVYEDKGDAAQRIVEFLVARKVI